MYQLVNKGIFKYLSYLAYGYFCYLLVVISLQYIPYNLDVAFLRIKQQYIHITHWKIAFFVHVYTSVFLLIAGFTQFSTYVRSNVPAVHRIIGSIYVIIVVFISGPASLIMAFYANGYLSSRLAFTILASLWIIFTLKAWISIFQRNFVNHQHFMIRSFSLTISAITLRIWKWLIVYLFHPNPMDLYMMVAWLGFVPNMLVAEWIIYYLANGKSADTKKL
ncbi:MAG: DUF2306 domain-containing protein [Cytophagales bacterium]